MLIWDCLGSLESLIGLDSLGGFGLFRMVWVESALLGSLGSSPHLPSTLPPAEAYALGHDPEYWDPAASPTEQLQYLQSFDWGSLGSLGCLDSWDLYLPSLLREMRFERSLLSVCFFSFVFCRWNTVLFNGLAGPLQWASQPFSPFFREELRP